RCMQCPRFFLRVRSPSSSPLHVYLTPYGGYLEFRLNFCLFCPGRQVRIRLVSRSLPGLGGGLGICHRSESAAGTTRFRPSTLTYTPYFFLQGLHGPSVH